MKHEPRPAVHMVKLGWVCKLGGQSLGISGAGKTRLIVSDMAPAADSGAL